MGMKRRGGGGRWWGGGGVCVSQPPLPSYGPRVECSGGALINFKHNVTFARCFIIFNRTLLVKLDGSDLFHNSSSLYVDIHVHSNLKHLECISMKFARC